MKTDYKPITPRRFFYNGDRNIENGGYFYSIDTLKWGYVEAVQVTPCSDASGPDNQFWIERITINIPTDPDKIESALDTCGYDLTDLNFPDAWHRTHMLIEACVTSGLYDRESIECIQIGKSDPLHGGRGDPIPVDKVLRGNTSLRRYARRLCSTI